MIERAIRQLKSEDPGVRRQAAEQLGDTRDVRAVEQLIAALDKDSGVRKEVAEALGKIGNVRAVEPLARVLSEWGYYDYDADLDVCRSTVRALGEIGDARAVLPLTKLILWRSTDEAKEGAQKLHNVATEALAKIDGCLRALVEIARGAAVDHPGRAVRAMELVLPHVAATTASADLRDLDQLYLGEDDDIYVDEWGQASGGLLSEPEGWVVDCSKIRRLARQELARRGLESPRPEKGCKRMSVSKTVKAKVGETFEVSLEEYAPGQEGAVWTGQEEASWTLKMAVEASGLATVVWEHAPLGEWPYESPYEYDEIEPDPYTTRRFDFVALAPGETTLTFVKDEATREVRVEIAPLPDTVDPIGVTVGDTFEISRVDTWHRWPDGYSSPGGYSIGHDLLIPAPARKLVSLIEEKLEEPAPGEPGYVAPESEEAPLEGETAMPDDENEWGVRWPSYSLQEGPSPADKPAWWEIWKLRRFCCRAEAPGEAILVVSRVRRDDWHGDDPVNHSVVVVRIVPRSG